jgi:uncharacterized protein (TIGR02679 family)
MILYELTDAEVVAVCGVLARRRPSGDQIRVTLTELDAALRAGGAGRGLIDTIEELTGPIVDRRARSADQRDRQAALWEVADRHPASRDLQVRAWLDSVRQRGRLTRLAVDDPATVLTAALDSVAWLIEHRAAGATSLPLPAVAARLFGDAHALDPDTPVGILLDDAIVTLYGTTDARDAWQSFGVLLDTVSSSALTYMLPGAPGTAADAARRMAEPMRVTHRMLVRGFGLDVRRGDVVWVCENPAIVALAADHLGDACQPLVCLDGMPAAVTRRLLARLRTDGAELRVHTDFDYGGIAITTHVTAGLNALPWRMAEADYLAGLDAPSTTLAQAISTTPWDPALARAMNRHRRAIHEEAIYESLLADLRR